MKRLRLSLILASVMLAGVIAMNPVSAQSPPIHWVQPTPSPSPSADASAPSPAPQETTPSYSTGAAPQPTPNLVEPQQPDRGYTPVTVTKFWAEKKMVSRYYWPYCALCFHLYNLPLVHWNFINQGGQTAKAIRFVVQETSPFGEGEGPAQFLDLTGTFAPGVSIESRVNITAALVGNGTHWNIYATKVLWSDGSVWTATP